MRILTDLHKLGLFIALGLSLFSCEPNYPDPPPLVPFKIDSTNTPFYYSSNGPWASLTPNFGSVQSIPLDPDHSGDNLISVKGDYNHDIIPINVSDLYLIYIRFGISIPDIEFSTILHIDTLCIYSDIISDSLTYTYTVNYHPDSVYPAGYTLNTVFSAYARPHEYGDSIHPSGELFTNLQDHFGLIVAKNGMEIGAPDASIIKFSNWIRGPWHGFGRKCAVFKVPRKGHLYYGWIELEVMNDGTVLVYSIYANQL